MLVVPLCLSNIHKLQNISLNTTVYYIKYKIYLGLHVLTLLSHLQVLFGTYSR
jgi:hypothetical protein